MTGKRPVAKPVATVPDSQIQFDAIMARLDEIEVRIIRNEDAAEERTEALHQLVNAAMQELNRTRNAIGTSEAAIKASVVNTGLSVIKELTPKQKRSWWQRMIGA